MKISLESLDGRTFELTLPREGGEAHRIALQVATRLRGVYLHEDTKIALEGAKLDEVSGTVIWQLAHGPLQLGGLQGSMLAVDLLIPRGAAPHPGPSGEVTAASLVVPAFELTVGATPTLVRASLACRELTAKNPAQPDGWNLQVLDLAGERIAVTKEGLAVELARLGAEQLTIEIGGALTTAFTAATLTLQELTLRLPNLALRIGAARIERARVVLAADGPQIEAQRIELREVDVMVPGERTVRCPGAIIASGVRFAGGDFVCNKIEVSALDANVRLSPQETVAEAPESQTALAAQSNAPKPPLDLSLLDGLQGQVNADLTVDVKIPFLSRRVATHKMRLDVRDGTIDFKQLEDGLARLEDALLDFRVRRGALALELKGIKKTLLAWPLDASELAVAERDDRVRLRTLAKPDLPAKSEPDEPPTSSGKDRSVGLSRLDVEPLEIALRLDGGHTFTYGERLALRLGARDRPAIGRLGVQGAVSYAPSARTEAQTLSIDLQALDVGLDKLVTGAGKLRIGRVALETLTDLALTLQGLTPALLKGSLRGLTLESLEWRKARS